MKIKAEAFATEVFSNFGEYCDYPNIIDAAVEIYKLSTATQTMGQLEAMMK